MKIGIDARMYGLKHAGIGRYVMNLVDRVIKDKQHTYVLFVPSDIAKTFKPSAHLKIVVSDIRHYSVAEQTQFLSVLNQQKLDLLHVPHFNVPYLYNRPFVVTIHDILWHQVTGKDVTTLSPLTYYLKYAGYKMIVKHAVSMAKAVIVPSNYVKRDLINTFNSLSFNKIHVTYEGVDSAITSAQGGSADEAESTKYILYVGSAYPHKNIPILLKAISQLDIELKLVGSRSVFLDKIKQQVDQLNLTSKVSFLGSQTDTELAGLIQQAIALVHPSKSEGFGLTGLEAMSLSCPVIAARATALPEIYGDAALFFEPDNQKQLVSQITLLMQDKKLKKELIQKGLDRVAQFSWDKMVDQTQALYNQVI